MPQLNLLSLLLALGLAGVHLVAGHLRFLDVAPRSRWLSFAGGVAVAYVFVQMLPELHEWQGALTETSLPFLGEDDRAVYLVALFGLATFYGLERAAKLSQRKERSTGEEEMSGAWVFWLHIAVYGVYNALIGYLLLHEDETSDRELFLFFVAMALHFFTNDYGLRQDHEEDYEQRGRWLLALAVVAGWAVGAVTEIHEGMLALLFALVAGGVILNVLKEELPAERESRFGAFAFGVVAYTVLLLAL